MTERVQPVPDDLRGERAAGVGEVPRVDLRAAVQQQRRDHEEDHQQHEPRSAGVRPGEPGPAALAFRVGAQPDHREGGDARQHRHREEVLAEADPCPVPDAGNREGLAEQIPVGLDDGQQQDDESPERERVRGARHRPAEQLALAEHLGELRFRSPARVLPERAGTLGSRLPGHGQPLQPPQPAAGDGERDNGDHQADDDAQSHQDLLTGRRFGRRRVKAGPALRRCQRTPPAAPGHDGPLGLPWVAAARRDVTLEASR
jgi:hypothetical protein